MPPRQKSKFEQWFSFSRHKRRFGAGKINDYLNQSNIDDLKNTLIEGDDIVYTYGSANDLNEHIDNLKKEFVGQSALAHYHATLIVLIRRNVDIQKNYQTFKALWLNEKEFLLQHLNTRWLISACDTFIDLDDDFVLKNLMMNAALLINTIKLQETENLLYNINFNELFENADKKAELQSVRVPLFDGTQAMAVGTDDTLRNMRWRLDKLCQSHELGDIVIEIFDRLQSDENNNVYSRSKKRHTRERTRWWQ